MKDFNYSIPTRIFFGRNKIRVLSDEIKKYGTRILLAYGGGSIKSNGLYDEVTAILKENGIFWCELSGIEPNPRLETVRKGVELCRNNNVELVLAVGGGSAIDCAKMVAAGYYYENDPWDLVKNPKKIGKALPVAAVLTIAATGSEMDPFAVISNPDTNEKISAGHPALAPEFSIMDPSYTFSVPAYQTAAGIADIMSHAFENYFSEPDSAFIQNRMAEAVLLTCIEYGRKAVDEPDNYDARANLMWASSLAINGLLAYGKKISWCVHPMEHELSAFYDITHGVGLAILTPVWMRYILDDDTAGKFAEYGVRVFGIDRQTDTFEAANMAIDMTESFFKDLNLPCRLSQVGINDEKFEEMAAGAVRYGSIGSIKKLGKDDVLKIFRNAL